jgi:sugar phosphate isomerase/epimerase
VGELEEVLDVVDDGVIGVTLDFCHAEATGQTLSLLENYGSKLCNVHISNRSHKPFDAETFTLRAFLTKLEECGYSGPLTMELSRKCTSEQILKTKAILENVLNK